MTQVSAISEKITTFRQLEQTLGLSLSEDPDFLTEWMAALPALAESESQIR
ncbi:MAG: hypothetical protein AAF728_12710 [Cyanobacteria bacterium P01_D01_bin.128]